MSKQLSAEWQQKIESDMHEISKKFKTGTEYDVGYDHGFHYGYSLSASNYVPQLVEAQERIKELEDGIYRVISTLNWIENGDEIEILRKALSPNNKPKEDE